MCATLLAIGSVIAGGSAAGAASTKPCDGRDELVPAEGGLVDYDTNRNGDVCAHKEKSVAPKKHGGSWGTTYYDDNA
jgi:hypothetical protein